MIVVFKLLSGEEVIGRMVCETDEEFDTLEMYELFDPMWIVPSDQGAMKLRDALMLSENLSMIFNPGDVITCYKPMQSFVEYYTRASEYSINFTRSSIATQIELATQELEESMREEKEQAEKLGEILRKITGAKLH